MDASACWLGQPEQWQPRFAAWQRAFSDRVHIEAWPQWGGQVVQALTVAPARGAGHPDALPPVRLLVAVPHAHEPAPTAASVDVACQLLEGTHLDGSPSDLARRVDLDRLVLTLLPDANPQGRVRSPQACWDGVACDNDTFLKHAFGVATDGERFPRLPEWRISEQRPQTIGLVWEQLDDDLCVESNSSRLSTYARATDALQERWRYTHLLEMHQHEAPEAILLPADHDTSSPEVQEALARWSSAILSAWTAMGAEARPQPWVAYRGQPRQAQFLAYWAGRCPGALRLNSEVRNNRRGATATEGTPLERQLATALVPLEATLSHLAGR